APIGSSRLRPSSVSSYSTRGRRLRVRPAVDQPVELQAAQRLSEDLLADAADLGAQVGGSAGAVAQRPQDDRVPGVGEQVEGEPGLAVGEEQRGLRQAPNGAYRAF